MKPSDIQRFFDKVKIVGSCWEWQAGRKQGGYGRFWYNGRKVLSHRFSYELFKGDIPEGMELDHLCRNRACCNPEHLEPVPHKENMRRGLTGFVTGLKQRAKTCCKQGHEFTRENTYIRSNDSRACKKCKIIRQHQRRQKNKVTTK